MYYWALLLLFTSSLFSLELSVQSGRENQHEYSILHLKAEERFLCESEKNDLDVVTSIICAFNKRPIQSFSNLENNFFEISSKIHQKTFFIIIKPKKKILLKAIYYDLIDDNELYQVEDDYARHWNIIGYKDIPPLIAQEKKSENQINFPVPFSQGEYPYVGGLDILGNPIHMTRVKDVADYLAIKKNYNAKRYDLALEMIDEVLEEFPDTIFKSELMLYQIRCHHEKSEPESLIQISKRFIREYSSDINMAEVLADTANAYSRISLFTDADYFYDRLFDEHKESRYMHLGLIYKAKQLQNSGNSEKALTFYKRAFKQSNELGIAALAAYQIILLEFELGHAKKADKYIKMILAGERSYFISRKQESLELALKLTSYSNYQSAADIAGALLEFMDKDDDGYEELLKNRGMWLSETENKEEALAVFNTYIQGYKYGEYLEDVKRRKDALFFDVPDVNASEQLEHLDLLMNKYAGDSIATRALYEKAELLFKLEKYQDVLDLKGDLDLLDPALYDNSEELIENSAKALMQELLQNKQCIRVVDLSRNYDINLSMEWDEELYECYIGAGNFDKAKDIAQSHIKSKNFNERIAWLERYTKIDFALGNYTAVVDAAKELISLRSDENKNIDTYRLVFDAGQRLGDFDTIVNAIQKLEALVGLHYDDIERYVQMVTLAKNSKDDLMLRTYAQKVMQLQEKAKSYTQTPYIEFTLAQALLQNEKAKEALEVLYSLDERNITKKRRSRQKYLMGTLFQKINKPQKSKDAYNDSIVSDTNSSWAKLAKDALKLMP
ncbi:MAG: flagellar protein [Campylobacterota bacterium]|nr:flagellar protein [Campylobacterota bacterium]